MSDITAVPLRPIKRSAKTALGVGIGLLIAVGIGTAWAGTERQVRMAMPPEAFLAQNGHRAGVVTTASGLEYQVIKQGTGPRAAMGDLVKVDYVGKLLSGDTFDASTNHGDGPAILPVGGMIKGWDEGLQLMNVGSKYRFWIAPKLGYGVDGGGGGAIPPNSVLVFDVTLRDLQSGGMAAMVQGMGGAPHGEMPPR